MPKFKKVWNEDGSLWNHRHELFCQNYIMGSTLKDSLLAAGYKAGTGSHANGLKIMQMEAVKKRLDVLRTEQADMYKITKERVIEELGKILLEPSSRNSDKIKAGDTIAKMMGYHAAKQAEVKVKTDLSEMSDDELIAIMKSE